MTTGYEMAVGEVIEEEEEVGAVIQAAQARGLKISRPLARQMVARYKVRRPQPVASQRGTGMTTGLPIGVATFAAASPAGTVVNLAVVNQEEFTARDLICVRNDYAVVPPAAAAGIPILVGDVRIGNRSVLASAAGMPVETFAPTATGGQKLAGGVCVKEGKTVLIQLIQGAVAIPAGEAVYVTCYLAGEE